MAIAAFTGNILVIIINHCGKEKNMSKTTELVFSNLAISDFLMSIYLFIIAISDNHYRNRYALYAEEWLRSPFCAIASFLMCTSSLMSVIMMLFISIDRYIVTSDPLSSPDARYKWTKIVLMCGWLFTCTFVGIPVIMSFNRTGDLRLYQFSSICSPSNIENPFYATWIILFVVTQLIFWILTTIFYVMLLRAVDKSRRAIRSSAESRNFTIAVRLSLILITDLITWLPIYTLVALTLNDGKLNIFTLQFAIILAIPLNSAVNPYIYTATGTVYFSRLLTFLNDLYINLLSSRISYGQKNEAANLKNLTKDQVPANKAAGLPDDETKANKNPSIIAPVILNNSRNQECGCSNIGIIDDANNQIMIAYQETDCTNSENKNNNGYDVASNSSLLNITSKDSKATCSSDKSIDKVVTCICEDENMTKCLDDDNYLKPYSKFKVNDVANDSSLLTIISKKSNAISCSFDNNSIGVLVASGSEDANISKCLDDDNYLKSKSELIDNNDNDVANDSSLINRITMDSNATSSSSDNNTIDNVTASDSEDENITRSLDDNNYLEPMWI